MSDALKLLLFRQPPAKSSMSCVRQPSAVSNVLMAPKSLEEA